ncbi:MAG TPA: hypothetical protein PKA88_02810 [Polyangiaceae bacterium]|nr:hypothetical protein [Polyangiaceae bacterium]
MASIGAVLGTFALPAQAGSYLDRAALLVNQAGRDADYLRARLTDKDLAKVIHTLASARVKAASTTPVPKEVTLAHPHLLLVLENYERAAEGAAKGQTQRFLIYQLRARDEERVLRGVLKQLGWPLPDTK